MIKADIFNVVPIMQQEGEIESSFKSGESAGTLIIPSTFADDLHHLNKGRYKSLQMLPIKYRRHSFHMDGAILRDYQKRIIEEFKKNYHMKSK